MNGGVSPILTQASLWHLFIAYAVVIGPLALLAMPVLLVVWRRGGAR